MEYLKQLQTWGFGFGVLCDSISIPNSFNYIERK